MPFMDTLLKVRFELKKDKTCFLKICIYNIYNLYRTWIMKKDLPFSHCNLHAKKIIVRNIFTWLILTVKHSHFRNVHFSKSKGSNWFHGLYLFWNMPKSLQIHFNFKRIKSISKVVDLSGERSSLIFRGEVYYRSQSFLLGFSICVDLKVKELEFQKIFPCSILMCFLFQTRASPYQKLIHNSE